MHHNNAVIILLVDDDEDDRYIFTNALVNIEYNITCLEKESGLAALKYLEETAVLPDYIFLDLNMPKLDGFETLKKIKQLPKAAHIPVIICTTSNHPSHKTRVEEDGAAGFISKPNTRKDLQKAIMQILTTI